MSASYEGMGLCGQDEYRRAYDNRLEIGALKQNELYVARFKVESLNMAYRIIGKMGRIALLSPLDMEFQLLNDDLRPINTPLEGRFDKNVWNSDVVIAIKNGVAEHPMRDACFANYGPDSINELFEQIAREHEMFINA